MSVDPDIFFERSFAHRRHLTHRSTQRKKDLQRLNNTTNTMQHLISLAALVLITLTAAGANKDDAINMQLHRLSRQPLTDAETAALADNSALTMQQASLDDILFKSVYGVSTRTTNAPTNLVFVISLTAQIVSIEGHRTPEKRRARKGSKRNGRQEEDQRCKRQHRQTVQ
jgi:hypothetical protein